MTYQNLISKGGNTFRIIMLILTLSILNISSATDLEMRMYNVGQANFVALRHGGKALIVDCGTSNKDKWGKIHNDLSNFLNKVENISVIITHQHEDHYNKIDELFQLINLDKNILDRTKIIVGGDVFYENKKSKDLRDRESHRKISMNKGLKENVTFLKYSQTGIKTCNWYDQEEQFNIQNEISYLLGDDVKTEILTPDFSNINIQKISEKNKPHLQNLIVKVAFGNRSILLTGDSSKKLVENLTEESKNKLRGTDVIVFPHHGSNASGMEALYDYLKKSCCLGIISSDPTGKDKLPRKSSKEDLYKFVERQKGKCNVVGHELTFGENKKSKKVHKKKNEIAPIFSTSSASLYYKLLIKSDGNMEMCDSKNPKDRIFETK